MAAVLAPFFGPVIISRVLTIALMRNNNFHEGVLFYES